MNLRISDGQLRFRVTREELALLLQGQRLELLLPLPSQIWRCRIQPGDFRMPLTLWEEKEQVTLMVDRGALAAFRKQLPSREGIEQEITIGGATLALLLEVDVRRSPKD